MDGGRAAVSVIYGARMTDWSAISNGATGAGTLVLALATFASVRSANRSARIAEQALSVGMRPVLFPSRLDDRREKIFWNDNHHEWLDGGHFVAKIDGKNIYLAMSVRNVGNGIGVLQGWHVETRGQDLSVEPRDLALFREQTRDLYVPPGDLSFWQAGLRDTDDEHYKVAHKAITDRETLIIHLLYSDHEGGQHTITRFAAFPIGDEDKWLSSVSKHWFLDRQNSR
jgi:hypothetical protein